MKGNRPEFQSNNAGGVLGGISSGQDVVCRFAVKPTSSILTPRKTVTRDGEDTDIITKGRHDPCVGIGGPPSAPPRPERLERHGPRIRDQGAVV